MGYWDFLISGKVAVIFWFPLRKFSLDISIVLDYCFQKVDMQNLETGFLKMWAAAIRSDINIPSSFGKVGTFFFLMTNFSTIVLRFK